MKIDFFNKKSNFLLKKSTNKRTLSILMQPQLCLCLYIYIYIYIYIYHAKSIIDGPVPRKKKIITDGPVPQADAANS